MKLSIMKKWVAALESGKYRKGLNFLRTSDKKHNKYCCLGILCDLYKKEKNEGVWEQEVFKIDSLNKSNQVLPMRVQEWAGMKSEQGHLYETKIYCKNGVVAQNLMELNDEGEFSFKDIAKVIKSQYKTL